MVAANNFTTHLKIFSLLAVLTGVFLGVGYLLGGTGGMIIALLFAGVMNFGSYWFSDRIVLRIYKADEITEEENPEIHRMVEELARNAEIPKPRIYKSSMQVPNAFATGRNPEKGVVCVTEGLMETLEDDEIRGVIAHELAHIRNRDTLINAVVATIAGAISVLAELAFWGAMFGGDEDGAEMFSALAFMIVTPLIATLIRLMISRRMEYRADSNAVKIAQDRSGLSSALQKINEAASNTRFKRNSKVQEATSNLFIENPFSGTATKLFSSHPSLENRLENIRETDVV